MLFWELRWGIAGLVVVIATGTFGYHLIEGWSLFDALWMVTITLTTIGYGEVRPLSPEGRAFTLLLIVGGVSMGTYTLGRVTRYVIEGGLVNDLITNRERRKMKTLQNHFIVVGMGRLGREIAADLIHANRQVVGIDIEQDRFERTDGLAMTVLGDATTDDVLHDAAIERAEGMAIATRSSATNVFVTLSARQINPKLHIVTRVDEPSAGEKAIRAGADEVINPFGITGARIAQGMLRPHAANLVDLAIGRSFGEFALEDIEIGDDAECHGSLRELQIPTRFGVMIIAVRKADGELVTATNSDTELAAGDVAVVIGPPKGIGDFAVRASGTRRPGRRPRLRKIASDIQAPEG